jgi:hypothetical protein
LVQEALDKLRELVRIFKARARIEAGYTEELSVALYAPVDPPRPYILTLSPASDLDSRHAHLLPTRTWLSAALKIASSRGGSHIEWLAASSCQVDDRAAGAALEADLVVSHAQRALSLLRASPSRRFLEDRYPFGHNSSLTVAANSVSDQIREVGIKLSAKG